MTKTRPVLPDFENSHKPRRTGCLYKRQGHRFISCISFLGLPGQSATNGVASTMEIYSLTDLDANSLKASCQEVHPCSDHWIKPFLSSLPGAAQSLAFLGLQLYHVVWASVIIWPSSCLRIY